MSSETTALYHPLALNPWNHGQNSYEFSRSVIEERVNNSSDELLRTNEQLKSFAILALMARIADHANANYIQYHKLATALADNGEVPDVDLTSGNATPHQLVNYLQQQPSMESIEIGRFTQAGDRHIRESVDKPIQESLEQDGLESVRINEAAHYKLKQFDPGNPSRGIFDRKKTVFSHFGGQVLTVVRNTILMHDTNDDMPPDLKEYLAREHAIFRAGKKEYIYARLPETIYPGIDEALEKNPPSSAIPLSTTYFSYRQS